MSRLTEPRPTEIKIFTLKEANAMLPLIRAIVGDVIQASEAIIETQERLKSVRQRPGAGANTSTGNYQDEVNSIEEGLSQQIERLDEFIVELKELKVELKGLTDGLIDFPAMHNGKLVNLCWKYGEEEIKYWHSLEGGFAGRQLITNETFEN